MREMKKRTKWLGAVLGFILLSLFILLGCFQSLDDAAMVKRFRVMAVSVNPPEIRPETTTPTRVSVLWSDPKGNNRPVTFAWVVCQGEVAANSGYQNCEPLNPALVPLVTDASNGGDQLTIPPIPKEAFEEIPSGGMVKATVIVLVCAGGTLPVAERLLNFRDEPDITKLCMGGDGIAAYKTLKIANGHTYNDAPNVSPVIQSVHLNEQLLTPDEAATDEMISEISANCSAANCETKSMKLKVTFAPQTFQSYTKVILDEVQSRREFPAVYWFATGGEMLTPYTSSSGPNDPAEAEWIPKKPGRYTLWAVANDNRGGISWQTFQIDVK